ncbi:MAG TPA: hypothetical protein PKJ15_00130 [Methanomassiliicoccales archaeon]|nr:hypothetical protein [Methanomassiliicoccales archaeon]
MPMALLFIIMVTLFMALSREGSRKDPYPRAYLYMGIFFGLVVYFGWLLKSIMTMGFS